MTNQRRHARRSMLMCGAAMAVAIAATPAMAQDKVASIDIPAQPMASALRELAKQSGANVLFSPEAVRGLSAPTVQTSATPEAAAQLLLAGTDLQVVSDPTGSLVIRRFAPQGGSAADGAEGTVEALIVTAQKREEDIQDVPIAISAFTQEQLENSQIAGGPDLMTQVPNFTFTKTNFSSYSIQIRGIGTQAISATTDPAVAIAFNNTPFIRNRFFEQEFYDLQRVEVLRGPQGTLYGRNATAGVVNIISNKPSFGYEAKLSGDVSNYSSTRIEGMVNVPLVEDKVALRLAGAWTKREGFVTNQITGNPIDGRDLWSTRLSLRFTPTDRLDVNLIWEHFEEDDDRLRSGKQLCNTHVPTEIAGITHVGSTPVSENPGLANIGQGSGGWSGAQGIFSQGCSPTSLYAPESFQTPNGFSLPYYLPLGSVFLPTALTDPYVSRTQSSDLRVIESTVDPEYRAKTDIVELQLTFDLTDTLSLASETAWGSDFIFSTQDFNRFNTASGAWDIDTGDSVERGILRPDGFFCDPQIGCADRLVAVDLSTDASTQFSQELRLSSDFEGPFNFSLGANFLRHDTEAKYYVFINSLSLIAAISPFSSAGIEETPYVGGETDNAECMRHGLQPPSFDRVSRVLECTYIDPNPIHSLNDQGHNYFLSRNPYKLISYAVFGEAYYNFTDNLKVTAGLRWTVDKKEAPRIPSWVLASNSAGYPVMEVVEQEWREPTGRLTIDWKPDLTFTDETLLYASYAHGYKAGGANPPPYGIALYLAEDVAPLVLENSATNPKTFDAEFVNAYELGAKNTMLDGRLTLNTAAFYYDYEGYQISQIVDRSATNLNFDAEVWGLEIEADWRPLENLRLGLKLGYEDTRVADGEQAIDLMDRTAGQQGWVAVRPFPSIPSNCILPEWLFIGNTVSDPDNPELVNLGGAAGGNAGGCELAYVLGVDPVTRRPYVDNPPTSTFDVMHNGVINYTALSTDPADFPGWTGGLPITNRTYPGWDPSTAPNNGQGFFTELGGNELPNAPHYTATITADYTVPLPSDWLMTLHTDLYYQAEAWTRIFNTEGYDKLKAYTNVNLAAIFTNDEAGWKVMAYVKNVFDRDSITGAFLNSDDTGLTTNVFLTEPRLYGLRVTKDFQGGPWWTGANPNHTGPYPLTVELSGQVQRQDAPYELLRPGFADAFSDAIDTSDDVQNRDLDWGDGRQAKLTWRPGAGPWAVSLAGRYGRTNTDTTRMHAAEEVERLCLGYGDQCDPDSPEYNINAIIIIENTSDTVARTQERHEFVDFSVSRDVGIGLTPDSKSSVSLGVRYGELESTTSLYMSGRPDFDPPPPQYLLFFPTTHHRYEGTMVAAREFKGTGPILTWDQSERLFGDDEIGHVNLDLSVSGGVLFGKQKASFTGTETSAYYSEKYISNTFGDPISPTSDPVDIPARSKSVSVPVVDVSLGLAYEIQRIKIGAGYRWERYFDTLDGGFDEKKEVDRTFDGPYFKLSVGFGG